MNTQRILHSFSQKCLQEKKCVQFSFSLSFTTCCFSASLFPRWLYVFLFVFCFFFPSSFSCISLLFFPSSPLCSTSSSYFGSAFSLSFSLSTLSLSDHSERGSGARTEPLASASLQKLCLHPGRVCHVARAKEEALYWAGPCQHSAKLSMPTALPKSSRPLFLLITAATLHVFACLFWLLACFSSSLFSVCSFGRIIHHISFLLLQSIFSSLLPEFSFMKVSWSRFQLLQGKGCLNSHSQWYTLKKKI